MKRALLALFAVPFVASACLTRGLHPLYDDATRVIDDGLVGQWIGVDDGKPTKQKVDIQRAVDDSRVSYLATFSEGKNVAIFRLVPLQLGGTRYVDVVREPIFKAPEARDYREWSMPLHQYGKVEQKEGHLVIRLLKEKTAPAGTPTLTQTVTTDFGPKGAAQTTVDVLTVDTKELQALVQKLPDAAFSITMDLVPAKPANKAKESALVAPFNAPAPASCGCFAGTGSEPFDDARRFFQELETTDKKLLDMQINGATVALTKDNDEVRKQRLKKGDVLKESFTGPGGIRVHATWTCTEVNPAPPDDPSARNARFEVRFDVAAKRKTQTVVGTGYCGC